MKKIKLGYFFHEGLDSIFTHGFMSFASIFIVVACLLIMGSFALLAVNVNAIIGEFESENIVLAYVDGNLSDAEARSLQPYLEATPNVESVTFISRTEAMNAFFRKYEDQSRFENIDASVFRDRYSVYVSDVAMTAETQQALAQITGIVKVNANLVVARGFVMVRNIVSGVSLALIVTLLIISLFIMSNTIKLTTFERREEIAIMRMVGATSAFIRWPFVFEGFLLGILGSLIAFVAQWGMYELIAERVLHASTADFILLLPFRMIAIPLFIIFIAIGFAVGVLGSAMAIRKYLKV